MVFEVNWCVRFCFNSKSNPFSGTTNESMRFLLLGISDDWLKNIFFSRVLWKTKSFNLKIPQSDSEGRHSTDFRTVFEIMIGPFSFCEIGKTWGTNKKVNKQTNKNWNFQFPQPDYQPRHSPNFRTVFGIMIGPFSFCKIGKT